MGMVFTRSKREQIDTQVPQDYDGYAVTASDTVDLPNGKCRGLICTTAVGNIAVQLDAESTAVITIGAAGLNEIYDIQATRVLATGTTATGIYALY